MEAIEEGRIDHGLREGGQQMAGLHQGVHGLVDIADEDHAGRGLDRVLAPGEGARGHEVLHDLHAVLVLEGDAGHLVEGHQIPEADQSHRPAGHVVKEIGHRGLAAGDQDAVRADLLVDVALAGAAGSQFAGVVVVLDEGHHARQQMPFHALVQIGRLHAGRAAQHVQPLPLAKTTPALEQGLQIHVRHLDGLEVADSEGRALATLLEEVMQGDDAPDAPHQQLFELLDIAPRDLRVLDPQVGDQGLVEIAALVEPHRHLVDDLVAAALLDLGLDLLRLVRAHVVLGQDGLDRLQAVADGLLVVGGAVHAEQILQHVHRHIGAFLDQLGQVLTDDLAGEVAGQQGVEAGVRSHW